MLDTVKISFNLVCTIKRDAERRWVASCPKLDVFSQGKTEEQARAALKEAIELWIESCLERHTLDEALRECGFQKVSMSKEEEFHALLDQVRNRAPKRTGPEDLVSERPN